MKRFFNTLAMFLANLLKLEPRSWKDSAEQVAVVEKQIAEFVPSSVIIDGVETRTKAPTTPLGYLVDAILNAIGFTIVVWIIVQAIAGFLLILPYLIVVSIVLYAVNYFTQHKATSMAS